MQVLYPAVAVIVVLALLMPVILYPSHGPLTIPAPPTTTVLSDEEVRAMLLKRIEDRTPKSSPPPTPTLRPIVATEADDEDIIQDQSSRPVGELRPKRKGNTLSYQASPWQPRSSADACGGAPVDFFPWNDPDHQEEALSPKGGSSPSAGTASSELNWTDTMSVAEYSLLTPPKEASDDGGDEHSNGSRRRLLSVQLKGSYSIAEHLGCRARPGRVPHQNTQGVGPRGIKKDVKASEMPLVRCLRDIRFCGAAEVAEAAGELKGVQMFRTLQDLKLSLGREPKFKSCALVGNGPSILKHPYGEYINQHEHVVRFNLAAFKKWQNHVGNKTSFWVLGHAPSTDLCCKGNNAGKVPPALLTQLPCSRVLIIHRPFHPPLMSVRDPGCVFAHV
ncbi:hypothetical protein CYMTET_32803 [Cymbomonas tetramitiformis]|uniref:beta-galactoside alpha-(2,6)-sialyltransferase n=1 Tax=Cymbomonas tetramitiformis TaxID=36881 RepID=A0AAE0KRV3_9CHLO|nr:hypothetical protein CYMTET_32803 [Cymbomonas tetramitiformis]